MIWNVSPKSPEGRTPYERATGIKPNETKRNETKRMRRYYSLLLLLTAASALGPVPDELKHQELHCDLARDPAGAAGNRESGILVWVGPGSGGFGNTVLSFLT